MPRAATASPAGPPPDPWAVDPDAYPWDGPGAAQLRFLLRFAILAPSTHNTQPWRFRVAGDDAIEVWTDEARRLPRIDAAGRQRVMSCAAALFHLRVAVRRYGAADVVDYLPDPARPALLARLRRGRARRPQLRDAELFAAIPRRRTNRAPFAARPVSLALAEELAREAAVEGAWLVRLHPHAKLEIARLVAEGDRQQFADRAFRRELAAWLAPRGSRRRDGIPMARRDVPSALPLAGAALLRTFDTGAGIAARERELATRSPVLAVLGTDLDEPRDWIAAGEAMEAVLLRATALGLGASFLNQAIEEPALRARIRAEAGRSGWPQLILRLGWGPEVAPTPRRALDDVVDP